MQLSNNETDRLVQMLRKLLVRGCRGFASPRWMPSVASSTVSGSGQWLARNEQIQGTG